MELKDSYSFEDIDKFEEELSRVIYMWRRYEGVRVPNGKKYSKSDFDDLNNRLKDYLINIGKFNWDSGFCDKDEE